MNNNNNNTPREMFLVLMEIDVPFVEPWQRPQYPIQLQLDREGRQNHQRNKMNELNRELQRLQENDPSFTTFQCHFPQYNFQDDSDFHNSLGEALAHSIHLRRLNLRALVVNEEMAQAVGRGIGLSNLTSVYVSDWIEPEKPEVTGSRQSRPMALWQPLFQGLQSSRTIQEVCFQTLTAVGVVALGQSLSLMKSLRKLILDEPVMTKLGAQTLATGIGESTLEALFINLGDGTNRGSRIGQILSKGMPRIGRILCKGIVASQTIQELVFQPACLEHMIDLGDALPLMKSLRKLGLGTLLTVPRIQALGKAIGLTANLESLTIWHDPEQDQSRWYCEMLYDALSVNKSLTTLTLLRIPVRGYDFARLSQGLSRNASITSLLLDSDIITENSINLLFSQGLRRNTTLTQLKFQNCSNCDEIIRGLDLHWPTDSPIHSLSLKASDESRSFDVRTLCRVVAEHPTLYELEISTASRHTAGRSGYELLRFIGEDLPNQQHLTHVNLSTCARWNTYPPPAEAQEQTRARLEAGRALVESIKNIFHIQYLNVQGNEFPSDIEHDIAYYTGLNRTGRSLLSANGGGVAASVWSVLLAKCQRQNEISHSLTFFHLREQPHLVQLRSTPALSSSRGKRTRSDEE